MPEDETANTRFGICARVRRALQHIITHRITVSPYHRLRSRHRLRSPLRLITALLLILATITLPAAAAAADDRDQITIDAVFGFGGHLPTERWAPATIYIHSPERSISGTMLIEYAQDAYQHARIAMPFSAVAATTSAHQAVISLPPGQDQGSGVRITLLDERGRRLATSRFTTFPSARTGSLGLPRNYDDGLLVAFGLPRLSEAVRAVAEAQRRSEPDTQRPPWQRRQPRSPWANITCVSMQPADLPLSPSAWDGATALVVSGDSAAHLSRAALDAVHQWILSGGRLVVVADGPGEQWRTWLPPQAMHFVNLEAPSRLPLASELRTAIDSAADVESELGARPTFQPVANLSQRIVRINSSGRAHGWKQSLAVDASEASVLAEGPAGFGFITILGFDPHRTTNIISAAAAGAVWKRALETIATDFFNSTHVETQQWQWHSDNRAQRAVNISLESLANIPVLGYGTFLVIAGSVVLLALLVGPFDYIVLRRRRALQRSWITALVWIALASAIAIAAPQVIRTDPSQVNRLAVIDQLQEPAGNVQTRTTALTGIYAGQAGIARLVDVDPASWWRGISAQVHFFETRRGASPVPTIQAAARGTAGSVRGNAIHELPLAQWTFRTFIDHSTSAPYFTAHIAGSDDGLRVLLESDVPVRVADAIVVTSRGIHQLARPSGYSDQPESDGPHRPHLTWSAQTLHLLDELPAPWVFDVEQYQPYRSNTFIPAAALALPGPDRRALAIQRRVVSGQWALLCMHLEHLPGYPALSIDANHTHSAIVRLLVPVPEGSEP